MGESGVKVLLARAENWIKRNGGAHAHKIQYSYTIFSLFVATSVYLRAVKSNKESCVEVEYLCMYIVVCWGVIRVVFIKFWSQMVRRSV